MSSINSNNSKLASKINSSILNPNVSKLHLFVQCSSSCRDTCDRLHNTVVIAIQTAVACIHKAIMVPMGSKRIVITDYSLYRWTDFTDRFKRNFRTDILLWIGSQ